MYGIGQMMGREWALRGTGSGIIRWTLLRGPSGVSDEGLTAAPAAAPGSGVEICNLTTMKPIGLAPSRRKLRVRMANRRCLRRRPNFGRIAWNDGCAASISSVCGPSWRPRPSSPNGRCSGACCASRRRRCGACRRRMAVARETTPRLHDVAGRAATTGSRRMDTFSGESTASFFDQFAGCRSSRRAQQARRCRRGAGPWTLMR